MFPHHDHQMRRYRPMGCDVIGPLHVLLDCVNVALCVTNTLISCCCVERYPIVSQISLKWLKFAIHENLHHLKPRSSLAVVLNVIQLSARSP